MKKPKVVRESHQFYMEAALAEAQRGVESGEPPFGCVLVNEGGEVIFREHDRIKELNDMSAHAETLIVRRACKTFDRNELLDLTLYTTVEPCAMCFTTAWLNNIEGIVYGATMGEIGQITAGKQREILITAEEINARSGAEIKLVGGILRESCQQMFLEYEYR